MTAVGRLCFKWVMDPTKDYTMDDVPPLWKEEVQALVDKETKEKEGEEDSEDTGRAS